MKKLLALLFCLLILSAGTALAKETAIVFSDSGVTVNGQPISESPTDPVYLAYVNEQHPGVPDELAALYNRAVTITAAGSYRFSGTATDAQIAVKAGSEDSVRLILDGLDLTCRTAPAIAVYSARDDRIPGEYAVTIELADGAKNVITGSHIEAEEEDGLEFDGAIGSQVSVGFEGAGSLSIDADNEGIEAAFGHLTINGGVFSIVSADDPINVSEDEVGVLTVNDGYVYSSVRPTPGGEGDGADSNGSIVFGGGTFISLAHPDSQDSGIDADMGSFINGGVIVGAGNMYDPIDAASGQLFMMLEFARPTDDLVVVTDENDVPVFAYDFPYEYTYIAFSSPALQEGMSYRVYLGGDIVGESANGLYTSITAYTPGTRMQHGAGTASQSMPFGGEMPEGTEFGKAPEMPEGMEFGKAPEMPEGMEPGERPEMPEGMKRGEDREFPEGMEHGERPEMPDGMEFGERPEMPEGMEFGERPEMPDGGFGGAPRTLESSSVTATDVFRLTRESSAFTNITPAQ